VAVVARSVEARDEEETDEVPGETAVDAGAEPTEIVEPTEVAESPDVADGATIESPDDHAEE
jgi:hypothetical protein